MTSPLLTGIFELPTQGASPVGPVYFQGFPFHKSCFRPVLLLGHLFTSATQVHQEYYCGPELQLRVLSHP